MTRACTVELLIEPLAMGHISAVYPLMRTADPSLSLAGWLRFARRAVGPRPGAPHGVLVARRAALKHPCGAVCYRRHRDMHRRAILTAEHFIAMDLLYPAAILEALIGGLEPVAHRLGCETIRSIVHGSAGTLIETLEHHGHMPEAITMTKQVEKSWHTDSAKLV